MRSLRGQRGAALAELMVALPIGLIVFAAAIVLPSVYGRAERVSAGRSEAVQAQEVGVERMAADVREANTLVSVSPSVLELRSIRADGTERRVRLSCASGSCRRAEADGAGVLPSPGASVIEGVRSGSFALTGDHVRITVSVDVPGAGEPVTIRAGATARNG